MVLPTPSGNASIDVYLLDGGLFMGDTTVLHANVKSEPLRMYCWAFYLHHRPSGRHLVWDVGLAQRNEEYTPATLDFHLPLNAMRGPLESIGEQIERRVGVKSEEIDTVLFSHAHWDHCRPIKHMFPNAKAFFGPGTVSFCSPGHLSNPKAMWDGNFFDPLKRTEKTQELEGEWQKFGAFDEALDFFGDGSLWICKAPGHMPGNLCCVVRSSTGHWILLGSDCCHSRELLDGKHDIAQWTNADGSKGSLHSDIPAAKDTIARLRAMERQGALLVLGHDHGWMDDNCAQINPALWGLLDSKIQGWVLRGKSEEQIV